MDNIEAKRIVEALLYMTDHPLTLKEIREVLNSAAFKKDEDIKSLIDEVKHSYDQANSGMAVVEVAGGFQVATRTDMAPWIRRLYKERLTVRLSGSALETLSIIAYKQPITRLEVEQIRGVEATGVMDTLLDRRLIKVVGRKETIGRPLLYGTTPNFLRQFGLTHLSDLPELSMVTPAAASSEEPAPDSGEEKELAAVGAEAVPESLSEAASNQEALPKQASPEQVSREQA